MPNFDALKSGGIAALLPANADPEVATIARKILHLAGPAQDAVDQFISQGVSNQHLPQGACLHGATINVLVKWVAALGLARDAIAKAGQLVESNPGKFETTVDELRISHTKRVFDSPKKGA